MRDYLLIAGGGAIGALARFAAGHWAERLLGKDFPWGTLLVNIVGCFVIGLAGQALRGWEVRPGVAHDEARQLLVSTLRHGLAVGFLGALTTFSALGWDTARMLEVRHFPLAAANLSANLLGGLLAVWCGMVVMRYFLSSQ